MQHYIIENKGHDTSCRETLLYMKLEHYQGACRFLHLQLVMYDFMVYKLDDMICRGSTE